MTESLAEALPKEIERVQRLIPLYEEVPYGFIAATIMKEDVKKAHKAMIEGDLPTMIAVYQDLKEYHE